jgi:diguanylate cyclase (GGDEF)-like protein/PAS domain S-box-containing protein
MEHHDGDCPLRHMETSYGLELIDILIDAMQRAPAPLVLTSPQGMIRRVNAAFERSTGFAAHELCGRSPNLLKSGLQGDGFYQDMWADLRTQGYWQGEVWNRRKDGSIFQECLSIVALRDGEGRPLHYLGMYSGMASIAAGRRRHALRGETDATTGLPNRFAFLAETERLCEQQPEVHVLVLDIDDFTELNEQYGLDGGDAVLRQAALRCTQIGARCGCGHVVGRVGPDEFAIGLAVPPAITRESDVRDWLDEVSAQLGSAMQHPFEIDGGRKLQLSATIGLAAVPTGQGRAAEALLHASSARRHAGNGCARRYEAQDAQRQLTHALREAIRLDRIDLAYQPKVDLRTGALAGLEALARWTREDGTSVPPAEFIPLAEKRGLIGLLGDRVLERAAQQLAQWQAVPGELPRVAINFSALQFHRADAARQVAQILGRHGVAPDRLELELTESLLIGEMDSVMSTLRDLRALGVHISIDDFGTGYSSLAYLRRFPIQCLKIDRQFVEAMTEDAGAHEIVRLIIALAHRLGLRCVAEGVETPDQLRQLQALGCDEGQGYLLSRPLAPEAAGALLAGRHPWAALFEGGREGEWACLALDQKDAVLTSAD